MAKRRTRSQPKLPAQRPASCVPAADRLHAKDLARLEGISPRTAYRLMRIIGGLHGRNRRVRWIDRQAYNLWLDTL